MPALERALAARTRDSTNSSNAGVPRRWCSGCSELGALRHRWCAARSPFSSFLSSVWASCLTLPREPPAPYRTLSTPAATTHGAATIFVVFDGATQEAELRALLTGVGARIVGGPSAAGVYTVDVASGLESEAIAQLRASPAFAERASSSTR